MPPSTQHADVLGRNNVIVQIQGDGNTVDARFPHLTLTRYLNRRRDGDGPSGEAAEILSPYALAIPFIGRDPVMADLWAWMEKDQPVSVRVLTARGGGGKTRLALELCDEATRKGWFAGFVTDRELQRFLDQQNLSTWGWNRPTLIVLDYAASRARLLHNWLVELADNTGDSGHPLRLLLLERHADPSMGWWLEAFGRGGGDADAVRRLLDPAGGPITLPAVGASERRAIFGATLKQVGSALQPLETPEFARRLAELSWGGEPLFLIMAGLTAARAGLAHLLAVSPTDVVFEVARHELHRIREIGIGRGIDGGFLAHMAAYVTLCQGLERSQAEEAIAEEKRALRYDSAGDPPRIYEALYDALPGEGASVAPVLPDLLGEAVMVLALGDGDSQKAEDAVARAAAVGGDRVVSAVVRTADDFGSIRKEALWWLAGLVREGGEDEEALMRISDQLPQETLVLREFSAELDGNLVERFRRGNRKDLLATGLVKLAIRLSAVGHREKALEAGQEAAALYRALASARPEVFSGALAGALNILAAQFSAVGRREEALEAGQEAVVLYRALASAHPQAFRPNLAMSLTTLAVLLNALGRRQEALEAGQEAVVLCHALASTHPEAFRPDLALSLNNLANLLRAVGRREEALESGRETVDLYRALVSERPQAFRPELAMSVTTLAVLLRDVGRWEEALEAGQDAVDLYRALASERPQAFSPDLANSLKNLAALLRGVGHRREALKAGQEAVVLYRALASKHPEAFPPDLATSLNTLANLLSDAGCREEALKASQEALSLFRTLVSARPEVFRPDLANSLNTLANLLSAVGSRKEALDASQEAASLYSDLVSERPEVFRPDLAMSLKNLALRLSALGRHKDGLEAGKEAVSLYRALASARSEVFLADLAGSLNNLANFLSAVGSWEAALEVAQEAMSLFRTLASASPEAHRPYLANSLSTLAKQLSALSRRKEALEVSQEAVSLYRVLASEHPGAFRPVLADVLSNHGNHLSAVGCRKEAQEAYLEALSMYRELVSSYKEGFRESLARTLYNFSFLVPVDQAVEACSEAVELLIPIFLTIPGAIGLRMKDVVGRYVRLVQTMGRQPDHDLLAPLVKAGFFETESENPASPDEVSPDPEEESQ